MNLSIDKSLISPPAEYKILFGGLLSLAVFWIFFSALFFSSERSFHYNYLFQWLFSAVILLAALGTASQGSGKFKLHWFVLGFGLFSLLAMASTIWSLDPSRTSSTAQRVIAIAIFLPGFWMFIRHKWGFLFFAKIYVLMSVLAVALGVLFYWEPGSRIFLSLGSAPTGVLFFSVIVIGFVGYRLTGNYIYIIGACVSVIPILAVGSVRGGVAIAAFLGVYFVYYFFSAIKNMRPSLWFRLLSVIGMAIILFGVLHQAFGGVFEHRVERNIDYSLKVLSDNESLKKIGGPAVRVIFFKTGWSLVFEELTFFGSGLHATYSILEEKIGAQTYTHVDHLEVLIGLGLFGAVLYFGIVFIASIRLLHHRYAPRDLRVIIVGALIAIIAISLTGRLYTSLPVWIVFVFICASPRFSEDASHKLSPHL